MAPDQDWPHYFSSHFLIFMLAAGLGFAALDLVFRGITTPATLARQWALHAALFALSMVLMMQVPISMVAAAELSTRLGHGLFTHWQPGFSLTFLIWVLSYSLMLYAFHRAGHAFSLVWAFHRVHHLDEIVDASTTLRHHPGESLLGLLVSSALAYALAPPISVVVAWSAIELLFDLWTHSRSPLPEGVARRLEWVVFTPRLHRVHHSSHRPETDSNYGSVLVIWDRLFGTFRKSVPEKMGLDDPAITGQASRDFDRLLLEPWRYLKSRA